MLAPSRAGKVVTVLQEYGSSRIVGWVDDGLGVSWLLNPPCADTAGIVVYRRDRNFEESVCSGTTYIDGASSSVGAAWLMR